MFWGIAVLFLLLAVAYAGIVGYYRVHWLSMPVFAVPDTFLPTTSVTVIVPARDEAESISSCIKSLLLQSYPAGLLEIVVVDDHSTDGTAEIARTAGGGRVRVLALRDALAEGEAVTAYKKQALALGVAHARGDLILTTDGDCEVPPDWIRNMAYAYAVHGWQCITGPVVFTGAHSLFQRFAAMDFLGMMLLTGAGFEAKLTHLANGASFGFAKKAFYEVGGYADNAHRASGDDVFLLHRIMAHYPGKAGFVKTQDTVKTAPPPTLVAFVQQRLRWGTKSAAYTDWRITLVLALVFFHCWAILLTCLVLPWAPVQAGVLLGIQISIKAMADYRMLQAACTFFGREELMRSFWPSLGFHILYIAGIGLASNLTRGYAWKGRRVR